MQTEIIESLRKGPGYVSGEEISRQLKISRAGIWKHIQDFRRHGYEIDAVPHLGYRIHTTPDKLFPWELSYQLGTKTLGRKIVYKPSMSSTMDEAMSLGIAGAVAGTVVCAETQTKGRGRMGRAWASPSEKGIYASIILRPRTSLNEISQLTLVCAVALCEALREVSGLDAAIKWPNDILIQGKKVAGILTELNAEMDRVKFVIVGLGVNVNTLASQLPAEGTSLKIETHKDFSRIKVFQAILRSLEHWVEVFELKGFAAVRPRWKEMSWTLGRRVKFVEPGQEVVGEAFDLAADGCLLLRKDTGEIVKKISGDALPAMS